MGMMKLSVLLMSICSTMVTITNSYRLLGHRSSSSFHRIIIKRSSVYTSSKDNNLLIHRSSTSNSDDGNSGSSIVEVDASSSSTSKLPTPGSPVIKFINKESNIASMSVAIAGDITQKAYTEACDLFNAVSMYRCIDVCNRCVRVLCYVNCLITNMFLRQLT